MCAELRKLKKERVETEQMKNAWQATANFMMLFISWLDIASLPNQIFRRVMHNFRHFSTVLWHYRRHVIYRRMLYTIMQHYMPIKLWTVIAAKTVVHDAKSANMRRYIATDYTMLHNVVSFYYIMLHSFASSGEKCWLGKDDTSTNLVTYLYIFILAQINLNIERFGKHKLS